MAGNGESEIDEAVDNTPAPQGIWYWVGRFFEGLHWLTERVIGLLRSLVTTAMFLVVAFVIYNAWESRNTVAVKPFQVPVAMGKQNHEQAGRIIANLLNRHLLEAQDKLQEQLNPDGIYVDNPVATEQQVLIEGESIKLPETGITIDNVIEFISGIFGRKNLNGSVYYEADLQDFTKTKLHLQITLRGRIISFSEDDLGEQQRALLPVTRPNGLNIQLISAMLKARSKEILSIASEDYNLYYYCTRETGIVEHDVGSHKAFFEYCRQLQSAEVTPKSLMDLKKSLNAQRGYNPKSIVGSVLDYLKDESHKRQATLCQSKANRGDTACDGVKKTDARPLAKARATKAGVAMSAAPQVSTESAFSGVFANVTGSGLSELSSLSASLEPVAQVVDLYSLEAATSRCEYLRTEATGAQTGVVPGLERQCFAESPVQQSPVQQITGHISSPEESLQSNQAEGDATQLLGNGLYAESLVKYREAISLNCSNAPAWANLGILLSTASEDSGVRDLKQAQCALLRATTLDDSRGWMRHSLCVAQAKEATGDLERFLSYESCREARQLEPISEALYDKLFYIDIGDRYRELEAYDNARDAYVQAMSNEKSRSCKMKKVVTSLLELTQKGISDAPQLTCAIYKNAEPTVVEEGVELPECEVELNTLMQRQGCV